LGVKYDEKLLAQSGGGPYTFRIQGAVHHFIGSFLPQPLLQPHFSELYVFDPDFGVELDGRLRNTPILNRDTLGGLQQMLHECNHYVRAYKAAAQFVPRDHENWRLAICGTDLVKLPPGTVPDARAILRLETHPQTRNAPTGNEIAGILPLHGSAERGGARDIIVFPRGDKVRRISEMDPSYEPMSYVIPFPHGNVGWHPFMERSRPLQRPQTADASEPVPETPAADEGGTVEADDGREPAPNSRGPRLRITPKEYASYR
jgi:hypothetical protein